MRKIFLRSLVASIAFVVGIGMTNLSRWLWTPGQVAQTNTLEQRRGEFPLSEDEKQLLEIYRQYAPAQTRHDRGFFERVETEDFVLFFGSGHLSREEDIQWMEKGPADITYENDVEYIKVFGETATVRGWMHAHYGDGQNISWPFTDVCVRTAAGWRIQNTTSIH